MKFVSLLLIPNPKQDSSAKNLLHEYDKLRFTLDKYPMLYSYNQVLKDHYEITKKFALIILRNYDEPKVIV